MITPYAAQVACIKQELAKTQMDREAVEIKTIDSFQGGEKDVIIMSCVRAQQTQGRGGKGQWVTASKHL